MVGSHSMATNSSCFHNVCRTPEQLLPNHHCPGNPLVRNLSAGVDEQSTWTINWMQN
jgi:hypothetical protein